MAYALQQLINGVTLGMIYGLIAVGYTMVYGIIGMINFAHGDVFMIGAFISLIALTALSGLGLTSVPLALALTLILATGTAALYGVGYLNSQFVAVGAASAIKTSTH